MRTDADLSAVRWHAGALNNGLIFGLTYHLVTRLPRAIVDNLRVVRPDATERELKRLACSPIAATRETRSTSSAASS